MFRFSFPFKSSSSSARWIQNQATDKYVRLAHREGYIARSAYKIAQIDDKFKLFSKDRRMVVVDLGAAPGGWSQVIKRRCSDDTLLFGVDRSPLATSLVGYRFIQGDFTDPQVLSKLNKTLEAQRVSGNLDVIVSDMCPDRSGNSSDYFSQADLDFKVLIFAKRELKTGGDLVMKMIGGPNYYPDVIEAAKRNFMEVRFNKPDSSRAKSDESFLVALSKLDAPRNAPIAYGGGLRDRKRATEGRGSSRMSNRKNGNERFTSYGLDDWPGAVKHRMRNK